MVSTLPGTLAEQPEDWTEPGAYPVVPGVHRIPLPLGPTGLRAVNTYVVEDADGLVLVDSGWASAGGEQALVGGLRALGHELDDVGRFLVTHAHHDHYTQALALRNRHGVHVGLGRGEQHTVDAYAVRGSEPPQLAMLRRCGASALAEEYATKIEGTQHLDEAPWGSPDSWLDDGQRIDLRQRTLDVTATPGHTRGHIVLRDAPAGLLFAGDHVLPHITPSIGFERAPEPMPLRSYLDSLRLVRDMADTLLLPAHGPVTGSVHTRIDELIAHHEARLDAALEQVRLGSETAFEVAGALPWTRKEHKLRDLDVDNQMLAVLEMGAHLDLLADLGQLAVAEIDGVRTFAQTC